MDTKISKRITLMSFAMTIIIVIYHCECQGDPSGYGQLDVFLFNVLSDNINTFGTVAMSYFFAVTGFLLFFNLNFKNYGAKIKKRVFSLFIPYLLWQAITIVYSVCLGAKPNILDTLSSIFFMSAKPPNGALWYVYAVFILALLSPIILLLFKNKYIGFISIISVPLVSYALAVYNSDIVGNFINYGYVKNIINYLPAYFFGAFCGYYYNKMNKHNVYGYCLIAVLVMLFANSIMNGLFTYTIIRILPIAIITLIPINENKTRVFHTTFLIYCIHQTIQVLIRNKLFDTILKYVNSIFIANVIYILLTLTIVILVAYLIYKVLNRFAPKVLALLTGGRAN